MREIGTTLVATVENILFTFVLLNRDLPDVETIYFVSIEQKKQNCLQRLPGVLVITKDAVICSANKYLGKLVYVF